MNLLTQSLEAEIGRLKKRLGMVESERDSYKTKLQKMIPRDSDWLQDRLLLFIGNPYIGSTTYTSSQGPITRVLPYEKTHPDRATISQICKYLGYTYPPKNQEDKNKLREVFRRLARLREREEIKSNVENSQLPRGEYRITTKGKEVWELINSKNEYSIRTRSSRGLDFEVNLQTQEIIVHNSTRDPFFYKKMLSHCNLLSKKERGRPPKTVFFKGDKKLSRELSHFLFSMICLFFDVKNGKLDRKTKEIARKIAVSSPYFNALLRGQIKK